MQKEGTSYEEIIAYLVNCGQSSMRATPLYITIPGGKVLIQKPDRPPDSLASIPITLAELARRAFPPPEKNAIDHQADQRAHYHQYAMFDLDTEATRTTVTAKPRTRPQKLIFVEQPIQVGTKKWSSEQRGWVIKNGWLGYIIRALPRNGYEVAIIHLKSNRSMASIYLQQIDETTHPRIQGWVVETSLLTDWSKGIAAILKEQPGEQKQRVWSRHIEALWTAHKKKPLQTSFF